MKSIRESAHPADLPIKVAQFGEGNFLRAFADWMIDTANEKHIFNGSVAIIKPTSHGDLQRFETQNNLYTVCLRGKQNGIVCNDKRMITSVSKSINCYTDYPAFSALAALPSLEVVISNTTEAGIVYDETDRLDMSPPKSYPGKLTQFLYTRYRAFGGDQKKGLLILPVELLEDNGKALKQCVLKLAGLWKLEQKFVDWVNNACIFCSTLVDRIVTGYPGKEESGRICQELDYDDELLDVAEPFALWVIEGPAEAEKIFPLDKAGLPVIFTRNQRPYRERKVRILNGAHTSTVLAGYLMGKDIVRECMEDSLIRKYMETIVRKEIVPTVKLPRKDALAFADAVFERFENPFVKHQLLSISLNSISKWKARLLPTFEDIYQTAGQPPKLISFSFAALLAFYTSQQKRNGALIGSRNGQPYEIHDTEDVLNFFCKNSGASVQNYVTAVMQNTSFWGKDLTQFEGFANTVCNNLNDIRTNGMTTAMEHILA